MEKEFVPYELAVKLKEIGFDEECFGYYTELEDFVMRPHLRQQDCIEGKFLAPTWQSAFRWFREKYNLVFNFISYNIVKPREYHWSITWNDEAKATGIVKTYEEAELACLKKLIQIVKEKL